MRRKQQLLPDKGGGGLHASYAVAVLKSNAYLARASEGY